MDDSTPGQRIRALRERLELSQIAFAGLLGVSNVTVNRWEHDRALPQPALLARIELAEARGIDALRESDRPLRGNLPREPAILGRDSELEALRGLLTPGALVTLIGPGGVGKTSLAIAAARQIADRFPDGVWFVDLAPVSDGGQVIHAVTHLLGIREAGRQSPIERLAAEIERRAVLLLLDNCEHLHDACVELIRGVTAALDRSAIVATSRRALDLRGETLFPVAPLALPDATALFIERAGPNLHPDPTELEAIARICDRLDRLPLAIELAAGRSHLLSVTQIASRIDRRFELLRSQSGVRPHHRELEATIAWSYDLLAPGEAALFRRLGIFSGWFDLPGVEAIWEGAGALDLLDRLSRQSLIVAGQSPGDPVVRYRLLESLAVFARQRLDDAGESAEIAWRHAVYYAAIAHDASRQLLGERHVTALHRLDVAHDNIASAFDWLVVTGSATEAMELAVSLAPYWQRGALFQEGSDWLRRVLALTPDDRSALRARALTVYGMLIWPIGLASESERALNDALALAHLSGDWAGKADTLDQLASCLTRQGDLVRAEDAIARAVDIRNEFDDPGGMARTLIRRGNLLGLRGDFAASECDYHRAWELAREAGDLPSEAVAVANLGELAAHTGDYARGLEFNRRSARIHELFGDEDRVAITDGNSAELYVLLGHYPEAVARARQAVGRFRHSGNLAPLANILYVQGVALAAAGARRDALASFREAVVIDASLNNETNVVYHLEAIVRLHADGGNAPLAARLLGGCEQQRAMLRMVDYEPFDRMGMIAAVRSALSREAFDHALAAGRRLTAAGLLAEALHLGEITDGEPSYLYRKSDAKPAEAVALTERQRDVLRLVALGRSNREIAGELSISDRTVERHLTTIFTLLGVDRRSAAVMEASARGMLAQGPL